MILIVLLENNLIYEFALVMVIDILLLFQEFTAHILHTLNHQPLQHTGTQQLTEPDNGTENPRVGGSIPSLATKVKRSINDGPFCFYSRDSNLSS